LGVVHYRLGNWADAIIAFDKSMHLREGGDSYDWFFLAMIYWQKGDKDKALAWYEKAQDWMNENSPGD
jgi:tetratricopeptide (TPR) repeat protein